MFKSVGLIVLVVAVAAADVAFLNYNKGPHIRILGQQQEIDPSGNYRWSYQTENGISAKEEGQIVQGRSQVEPGTAAQGSFAFTSPEGLPVAISYTADENGFQPQGNVLPVAPAPPAIPPAILRSLEWNRAHPEEEQPQQKRYRF